MIRWEMILFKKVNLIFILSLFILIMIPIAFATGNETILSNDENVQEVLSVPVNGNYCLKASNDYYFNASVENDGDGSINHPYKFLKSDRIKANSNIYLANGEYELDTYKNIDLVNIYGSDVDKTIVRYDGVSFTVSNSLAVHNVTFMDLSIVNRAKLNLTNVIFSYGYGSDFDSYGNNFGGAISTSSDYPNAAVNINNCTFDNNFAVYGGAIYMGAGNLEITDSIFINNTAYNFGGAIACENNVKVAISKSKFFKSQSLNDAGGAIYIKSSELTAKDVHIENSSATFGAGITTLNSPVNLNSLTLINNTAKYAGGAIYHMYGSFLLVSSTLNFNSAVDGGALFIDNSTNLQIRSNKFNNNIASNCAGAIYSLLNKIKSPIQPFNKFDGNAAKIQSDVYELNNLNIVIGDGNYTLVKVNNTQFDSIPDKFSLIDEKLVTVVKDQQKSGNCWAFTAISVLESCLIKATGNSYDLSEENMKNIAALFSDYGWTIETNDGGYDYMPWGYLVSWLGPVSENDDLFDDKSVLSPILNSIFHIQNVIFLTRNNYTDNDAIKEALMKYGAVGTSMYYENKFYNSNNNAYYCYSRTPSNHAVTIVGWDDNYSKTNFAWSDYIKGDGAWIVRNSWSPSWGDNGYFYVSYYDEVFAKPGISNGAYTFILNDTLKYDKNYQYDISGMTGYFINSTKSVWYKNVFTASDDEYLAAISTYFEKLTNWTASIYLNDDLVYVQNGISKAGYYTINLDHLIPLKKGDVFEVIFNISSEEGVHFPISEKSSLNKIVYGPKMSYVSYDGVNWMDLYDLTFSYSLHNYYSQVACIKAFTILNEVNTLLTLNITYDGILGNITAFVKDQYGNLVNYGKVIFNVNDVDYEANVSKGIVNIPFKFLNTQNVIYVIFNATGYASSMDYDTVEIEKQKLNLNLNTARVFDNVTVNLTLDDDVDIDATLVVNGNNYSVMFVDGFACLELSNLKNGVYNVSKIIFPQESVYENLIINKTFSVNIKDTRIIAGDLIVNDEDNLNYTVKLIDGDGNILSNKTVEFVLNGSSQVAITDVNGEINIPIHLNPGHYSVKIGFNGDNDYRMSKAITDIKVKNKVNVDLFMDKFANNVTFSINVSEPICDNVTLIVNNNSYILSLADGFANFDLFNLDNGNYTVGVLLDIDKYDFNNATGNFTIDIRKSKIITNDLITFEDNNMLFNISLVDEDGNPLVDRSLIIILDNETFNRKTDEKGQVNLLFNLTKGIYTVHVIFEGDGDYFKANSTSSITVKRNVTFSISKSVYLNMADISINASDIVSLVNININGSVYQINDFKDEVIRLSNLSNGIYFIDVIIVGDELYEYEPVCANFTVDVKNYMLHAQDFITVYRSGSEFKVTLTDDEGNLLAGKKIQFNLNNHNYINWTDDQGQASVKVNLGNGKYLINVTVYGDVNYRQISSSYDITVKTSLEPCNITTKTYNSKYSVLLLDKNGNPLNSSGVTFILNDAEYHLNTDENGYAYMDVLQKVGNYNITIVNDWNNESVSKMIKVVPRISQNRDLTIYAFSGKMYKVRIFDDDGRAVGAGQTVKITIGKITKFVKTNAYGYAYIRVNLKNGKYIVSSTYKGFKVVNRITIKPVLITLNKVYKKSKSYSYKVKLLNSNGKPLIGKKVIFKIKGKTYIAKTNRYGQASFVIKLNLNVGNYKVYTIYGKSRMTNLIKIIQ